jgi:hypothetical protein
MINELLTGRDKGGISRLFRGQFHYAVIRLKELSKITKISFRIISFPAEILSRKLPEYSQTFDA